MTCSGASLRRPVEQRQRPLQALVVGDQHLGAGVGEAVLHLRRRPPRVHPDDGGADRGDRPVADHPLRVVAHRQGDAVAGARRRGRRAGGGRAPGPGRRSRRTCSARPRTRRRSASANAPSSPTAPACSAARARTTRIGMPRTSISVMAKGAPGAVISSQATRRWSITRTMMARPGGRRHSRRGQVAGHQAPMTVGQDLDAAGGDDLGPQAVGRACRRRPRPAVTAPICSRNGSRLRTRLGDVARSPASRAAADRRLQAQLRRRRARRRGTCGAGASPCRASAPAHRRGRRPADDELVDAASTG